MIIMRLFVYCKKCSAKNTIKFKATDRVELKKRYGDKIDLTCKKCNAKNKYETSDIKAEHSLGHSIIFLLTITSMFLVIWLLWDYAKHQVGSQYLLPVAVSIPLLISVTASNAINHKIRIFNRS